MGWAEFSKVIPDLLQGIGALVVLGSAWTARQRLGQVRFSWDGLEDYLNELRSTVRGQFRDQSIGFGCFVLGLVWKLALGLS